MTIFTWLALVLAIITGIVLGILMSIVIIGILSKMFGNFGEDDDDDIDISNMKGATPSY